MNPRISGIAIITSNRAFSKNNGLLFHIPGDLPRFKKITASHPLIMGRKAFEMKEINSHPLPGRLNIIVTRNKEYEQEGVIVCDSIEKAIEVATEAEELRSKNNELRQKSEEKPHNSEFIIHNSSEKEIFIIGGVEIFKQTWDMIERLYLTVVEGDFEGDVFFPDYSDFKKVISEEPVEREGFKYKFLVLER